VLDLRGLHRGGAEDERDPDQREKDRREEERTVDVRREALRDHVLLRTATVCVFGFTVLSGGAGWK
jgi:hypothetical protein